MLAIIPDWYAGQPLVYFELLDGPDAGKVQYVAEQITEIAPGWQACFTRDRRSLATPHLALELNTAGRP